MKQQHPILMTLPEFSAWARIGRTRVYEEIGSGALRAIKIGRRTLIRADDADQWLDSQPAMTPYEVRA